MFYGIFIAFNRSMRCNVDPPLTPNFYREKTGVYRGIHFFHIFALKHRLWVLARTASLKIYVLSNNVKNITIFHLKINIFTSVKYCCILHGRVFVMALNRSLRCSLMGCIIALNSNYLCV